MSPGLTSAEIFGPSTRSPAWKGARLQCRARHRIAGSMLSARRGRLHAGRGRRTTV